MSAVDHRSRLIRRRRSHSLLVAPGPDALELQEILLSAVSAPDHGRLRPWRFTVFTGEDRARFGDVLAAALQAREPATVATRLDTERRRLLRAPVVVAVGARVVPAAIGRAEQVAAVAAAVQNMLLAATELGFGSIWRTGAACSDVSVKASLGLRPHDEIVGFVYLGTPVGPPPPRPEPSLDAVVRMWGEPSLLDGDLR